MINYFLERTSGLLTSTGAASKRTVRPSRSLFIQNWREIVLPTRDTKDKKKPPGVSETTMAYFKVAFQALSEAVDGAVTFWRLFARSTNKVSLAADYWLSPKGGFQR